MPSTFGEDLKKKKKLFFFSFCCHGNHSYGWNSILLTTLVELHPKNIPAKFHQDWPTVKGEKMFKELGTDGQMNAGQRPITIPHLSTSCSGELKNARKELIYSTGKQT